MLILVKEKNLGKLLFFSSEDADFNGKRKKKRTHTKKNSIEKCRKHLERK